MKRQWIRGNKDLQQVFGDGWKPEKVAQNWEQAVIILLHTMEKTGAVEMAAEPVYWVPDTHYELKQFQEGAELYG